MDLYEVLTRFGRGALGLVLVASVAAGATPEQDRLQCLGAARRDFGLCLKDARARCDRAFRERLPGCFGGPACPTACLETADRCEEPVLVDRDGCRLACQADQKAATQGCRLADDKPACRALARTRAATCKAECTRRAERPLRQCRTALGECLRACARAE